MNRLFIADKDFSREVARTRAKGYKRVVIPEELEMASPFQFETQGTDLVATPVEFVDGEGECYTILCREFGLVGYNAKFTAKVSVIFCDNGWMLVTLYHGGIVMNLDDRLLMPTVGNDFVVPKVKDNILWVDADKLLGYSKYLEGSRGNFMYDHEFMLELCGDNAKGMGNFIFRSLKDEDIDISLGYVARYEQELIQKQQAREAQQLYKSMTAAQQESSSTPYEFDEPEPPEEEEDDGGIDW